MKNYRTVEVDWRHLMEYYLKGMITGHEFSFMVFTTLNEDNIRDFMDNATIECVDLMQEQLAKEPTTDEGWDKMLIAGLEWRQEWTKPTLARIRKGVEAVRRYFDAIQQRPS